MRNSRSLISAFALLAVLALPASADWENPTDDSSGGIGMSTEEMIMAAQLGYQIAQVAL